METMGYIAVNRVEEIHTELENQALGTIFEVVESFKEQCAEVEKFIKALVPAAFVHVELSVSRVSFTYKVNINKLGGKNFSTTIPFRPGQTVSIIGGTVVGRYIEEDVNRRLRNVGSYNHITVRYDNGLNIKINLEDKARHISQGIGHGVTTEKIIKNILYVATA